MVGHFSLDGAFRDHQETHELVVPRAEAAATGCPCLEAEPARRFDVAANGLCPWIPHGRVVVVVVVESGCGAAELCAARVACLADS